MYEVEYKVELTPQEFEALIASFSQQGFTAKPVLTINDYYIEAKKAEPSGYDLKRYRDQGDKIFYTEKIWEEINSDRIRKELEHEVTREEFDRKLPKYPKTIAIRKTRKPFSGTFEGNDMHIDMDSIKFDHSPSMRYFIEAEILCPEKEKVTETKQRVINFLKNILGKSELVESPGMFTMAFEKR